MKEVGGMKQTNETVHGSYGFFPSHFPFIDCAAEHMTVTTCHSPRGYVSIRSRHPSKTSWK